MRPCQLLIAAKADVDATDGCALMFNLFYGFCVVFFSCLPLTRLACSDGKTPLKRAIEKNRPDVVVLLRSVDAAE
jgi:hypothetical protein